MILLASSIKGEGVLTQEEVKALGGPQGFEDLRKSIRRGYATGGLVADTHRVGMGAVSAINSGGGNSSSSGGGTTVNVNHDPSLAVTTRDDGNGNIDVYVRKIVEDSWNQLSRPNSKQSKLMGQNFNAPRRR